MINSKIKIHKKYLWYTTRASYELSIDHTYMFLLLNNFFIIVALTILGIYIAVSLYMLSLMTMRIPIDNNSISQKSAKRTHGFNLFE